MGCLWRHEAEAAQQLCARDDAKQEPRAVEAFALTGRQHRRHDDRSRMHGTALERVVVILAVGRGAVDERRAERVEPAGMTERRTRAVAIHGRQGCCDVLLATRSETQPGYVE